MPHEMHNTTLGVKVHPDQDFDLIWRFYLRGSNPGFRGNWPISNHEATSISSICGVTWCHTMMGVNAQKTISLRDAMSHVRDMTYVTQWVMRVTWCHAIGHEPDITNRQSSLLRFCWMSHVTHICVCLCECVSRLCLAQTHPFTYAYKYKRTHAHTHVDNLTNETLKTLVQFTLDPSESCTSIYMSESIMWHLRALTSTMSVSPHVSSSRSWLHLRQFLLIISFDPPRKLLYSPVCVYFVPKKENLRTSFRTHVCTSARSMSPSCSNAPARTLSRTHSLSLVCVCFQTLCLPQHSVPLPHNPFSRATGWRRSTRCLNA